MTKRVLLVLPLAALLTIGAFVASSMAQERGMGPGHPGMRGAESSPSDRPEHFGRRGHGLEAIMKKLGITDEQKKQIRSLYVGFSDRYSQGSYRSNGA